jgi:hypothetical protein
VRLIAVLLTMFFAGSAAADDWKEYENRDYSFSIHFPADPTVETATYQAGEGRSFAAAAGAACAMGAACGANQPSCGDELAITSLAVPP